MWNAEILHTVHCTLYSVRCTLYTVYTVHYTLYTVHCKLYTVHCALWTVHYTLYTVYTAQCTLCTIHCTLCTVLYTLYTVYTANIRCTLYTIHCALYTVHFTLNPRPRKVTFRGFATCSTIWTGLGSIARDVQEAEGKKEAVPFTVLLLDKTNNTKVLKRWFERGDRSIRRFSLFAGGGSWKFTRPQARDECTMWHKC
jgi:hypothetical protein